MFRTSTHLTEMVGVVALISVGAIVRYGEVTAMSSPLYRFPVRRLSGARCKLDAYSGAVLLIVNVASPDPFTRPYCDLELLHRTYCDREFAVLGFRSDDFNHQNTGSSGDTEVCSTADYDVQFPIFDKIVTKGVNQHPLYRYLTAMQPVAISHRGSQLLEHLLRSGYLAQAPARGELLWNFEKFLISRNGKVVARFAPDVTVDQDVILKAIEQQLKTPMKPRRRTGPVGRIWPPALLTSVW
jgi:glutathione peroxidase